MIDDYNNIDAKIKELLFFSIERIIMTKNHLDAIHSYILRHDINDLQTDTYYENLKIILKGIIHHCCNYKFGVSENDKNTSYDNLLLLFMSIKQLQTEFNILPKEDAPIELHRFMRIFHRDGLTNLQEKNNNVKHVFYLSEQHGNQIYESTPLAEFKNENLATIPGFDNFNKKDQRDQTQDIPYHIKISRIETCAPLYWPTLAHEIAHQIMDLGFFKVGRITQDWAEQFGELDNDKAFVNAFRTIIKKINSGIIDKGAILDSWLTECWCDLYAYYAVGPAFIFAQKGTFLFNRTEDNLLGDQKHPPSSLRLNLLFYFAKTDQNDLLKEYDTLGSLPIKYPANILLPDDKKLEKHLNEVTFRFSEFFKKIFNIEKLRAYQISEHIKKLQDKSIIYNKNTFQPLINRLNTNYPIPSIREDETNLTEKETTVQEVMLAAWLSYEETLKTKTINTIFENLNKINKYNQDKLWNYFSDEIVLNFDRFNESVLRSLQIGEWVNLLKPQAHSLNSEEDPIEKSNSRFCINCDNCEPSVLVDHEIINLIQIDHLKIIPLIDISSQLGACSLDIRLGPSFQTYQPNQSGVIDLIDEESVKNIFKNSTNIDLDFMQPIVLAPGQFVLAHTMEYIGLPENIAAQIEGRSSFARLGLQVHMTANLIDPGFHGSITFEIFNAGPNPIRLYPGYRIGQIRFYKTKQPLKPYNLKKGAKFKGMFIHSTSLLDKKDNEIEIIEKKLNQMKESNRGI